MLMFFLSEKTRFGNGQTVLLDSVLPIYLQNFFDFPKFVNHRYKIRT